MVAALVAGQARPGAAVEPVESFDYLVTGNGFGFQVFDVNANAIKQYLEHPYRYLRPNPQNPDGEGIVRRNLVFDSYFGVRAGNQSVWLGKRPTEEVGYVDQSNVIASVVTVGSVKTTSYYVAPYGYDGNAMIMLLEVENTGSSAVPVEAFALANFKMGSAPSPDSPQANGESIQYDAASGSAVETGPGGGAMIYLPIGGVDAASCATDVFTQVTGGQDLSGQQSCSGDDRVQAFQHSMGSIPAGGTAWWGIAILYDENAAAAAARAGFADFLDGAGPDALLTRILTEFEDWRTPVPGGLTPTERRIWRQSETVLRMGQTLEPWSASSPRRKNHGMVLASLPPGGWHSGWVRDAVYGIVAMARTGHFEEARWALDFFLNAEANKFGSYLNDVTYRITTVRYFGNGEEEADFSGHPTRNIEIDGWGLFLWAARTYVDLSGDTAWLDSTTRYGERVYDVIKDEVAEALAANLEPNGMAIADASIWEVHWGNREHFLYTTASTARGFCDMAALAKRIGAGADRDRYEQLSANAVEAIRTHFVDSRNVLAGSVERLARGNNYRDGAVVEAFTWELIGPDDPIFAATMNDFSYLQTPAGGYKRIEGSNDQYDTDEWIFIDLRASEAWRRLGNGPKADELLGWVTAQASVNFDLIPELYNTRSQSGTIGAYSGSTPMVGYGAGIYQLALLQRIGVNAPTDCGTVDSYPDAGPWNAPDAGDDDGGFGVDDPGRTGTACFCHGGGDAATGAGTALLALFVLVCLRRRREA